MTAVLPTLPTFPTFPNHFPNQFVDNPIPRSVPDLATLLPATFPLQQQVPQPIERKPRGRGQKAQTQEPPVQPKPKPVSYPKGDEIVAKIKDLTKRQNDLKEAINKLKKDYNFDQIRSDEDEFRNELYQFMLENNLKAYRGFRINTCQPKELTTELNYQKKIKNIKEKIGEVVPDLESELVDEIAENLV